jgi:hypothetical protein
MNFPRVLVVALGRINAADTSNNGLLLRNLFVTWPRENLAQIYSSGNNGDHGYFGHYYQLGPQDRRSGFLFYKLKAEAQGEEGPRSFNASSPVISSKKISSINLLLKRLIVDTGIYEIIFQPRLSNQMLSWVKGFNPDIIFCQGYNLTFSWLPVFLKKETGTKLAFLATDDWPKYLYNGQLGEPRYFRKLLRVTVQKATSQLMAAVDIPFAFGQPMADEFEKRYSKAFTTLSHGDDPQRFETAVPQRCHPPGIFTILSMGYFNKYRWPLLLDADECCRLLSSQGIHVRVAVLSSGIDPEGVRELSRAKYIDLMEDPGNDLLPSFLKGADLLLLIEGFEEGFVSAIRLSVSSKSHLFMFSGRPIIVYAHSDTGVSKYASEYRWASVVTKRDVRALLSAIKDTLSKANAADSSVSRANEIAIAFHLREANKTRFFGLMTGFSGGRK